jgi:peptidyl-prolyl cis-trans isomerase-like 1
MTVAMGYEIDRIGAYAGKHTIFGRVTEGMTVVYRMGIVDTNRDDKPLEDVKIVRAIAL